MTLTDQQLVIERTLRELPQVNLYIADLSDMAPGRETTVKDEGQKAMRPRKSLYGIP